MYKRFFKRFLDLVRSLIGIVRLSPLFLFLIIAVELDYPGPVFFRQKRVGIHKTFLHEDKFYTGHYGARTA